MTPATPAMATFSELVRTALRAATHQVGEGSRRNARLAVEASQQRRLEDSQLLAALPRQRRVAAPVEDRRSA